MAGFGGGPPAPTTAGGRQQGSSRFSRGGFAFGSSSTQGFFWLLVVCAVVGMLGLLTARRLRRPLPVYFVHVPKTGSSLINVLIAHGCPGMDYGEWNEPDVFQRSNFWSYYVLQKCNGAFSKFEGGHHGVPDRDWDIFSGHFVGLFRPAYQRVASGYMHNFHDCRPMQKRLGCEEDGPLCSAAMVMDHDRLAEYARCVAGCAVKMLNGIECRFATNEPVTDAQVETARRRVREHFAFVGRTDAFEESVYLWNCQFEASVDVKRLKNTRPHDDQVLKKQLQTRLQRHVFPNDPDPDDKLFQTVSDLIQERTALHADCLDAQPYLWAEIDDNKK